MSSQQLTKEALQLSPFERVQLAQELWESVFDDSEPWGDPAEKAHLAEAIRRADEMESGAVRGIPLEQVMASLRSRFQ